MEVTLEIIAMSFTVSLLAGFVDSISGGGGLIMLPSLMLFGLNPAQALATNKFQAIFGKLSAVQYYLKHGLIDFSTLRLPMILSFISAGIGALLVQYISTDILTTIFPYMIGGAACYILFSSRLGDIDVKNRISVGMYGLLCAPLIAFYDGFFGPASGSFVIPKKVLD